VINFVHFHRAVQNVYNIRPEIAEVNPAQWTLEFFRLSIWGGGRSCHGSTSSSRNSIS